MFTRESTSCETYPKYSSCGSRASARANVFSTFFMVVVRCVIPSILTLKLM